MTREAYAANYYDGYLFLVRIDGFVRAAFNKCTGLSGESEVINYSEGGNLQDFKSPGKVSYGDITLERGKTSNNDMYDWWKKVFDVKTGNGNLKISDITKSIIIERIDRSGASVEKWKVYDAWPKTYKPGDHDADSNEKLIESMELVNGGFELIV